MSLRCAHLIAMAVLATAVGAALADGPDSASLPNDNPAKKVGMKLLSVTPDDEGDATLDVADRRAWSAAVSADNSGTGTAGRARAGALLRNDNLWGLGQAASVQYATSAGQPGDVKLYGAGYHIPLAAPGDSLDFYGSYSNVDTGAVTAGVFDLAISGKGAVYGARYKQSLARYGNLDGSLAYGIDYKAFKDNVQLLGQQFGNDVTVHPLSVTYMGNWSWAGTEASAAITGVRNVAGGTNGSQADFSRARSGATANYNILRLAASLSHILPKDWQARIMVKGQYTSDALLPGEQFGAGGATSVRGFAEREIADDIGLAANLELYTPNLCGAHAGWNCRALAFYDSAYIKRNRELAGELSSTAIGSVGVGLRMLVTTAVNLQLDYGHVVRAGATDSADANRVHLRMSLSY